MKIKTTAKKSTNNIFCSTGNNPDKSCTSSLVKKPINTPRGTPNKAIRIRLKNEIISTINI
jgi:hypothetical protein